MPVNRSFLEYCGETGSDNCGYCKNTRCTEMNKLRMDEPDDPEVGRGGSVSLGLLSHSITPEYMMQILEKGWSAIYCEKSNRLIFAGVLAPALTTHDYLALMDRGWRRSGKFLYKPTNEVTCCPQYTIRLDITKFHLSRSQKRTLRQMNEYLKTGKKPRCGVKEEFPLESAESTKKPSGEDATEMMSSTDPPTQKTKKDDSDDKLPKKKQIRIKRFEEKCRMKNIDINVVKEERKKKEEARRRTVESYILDHENSWAHNLKVELVPVDSAEFNRRDKESFELYKKYQSVIHKDEGCRLSSYRHFLCASPLLNEEEPNKKFTYGSYHLRFILDDKLIAVSVVDVLPRCLSAKYMFYDPDYSFLSLGTYTALREIERARKFFEMSDDFKYYYMGYYIETCPKMRYKAKFRPSDLLCNKTFEWKEFETSRYYLENSKAPNGYTEFYPDGPSAPSMPIRDLVLFIERQIMTFSQYLEVHPEKAEDTVLIAKLERLAETIGPHIPDAVHFLPDLN